MLIRKYFGFIKALGLNIGLRRIEERIFLDHKINLHFRLKTENADLKKQIDGLNVRTNYFIEIQIHS